MRVTPDDQPVSCCRESNQRGFSHRAETWGRGLAMSWFNNRSIRTKLLGSFIAVVALLGVATGFAILAIQQAVDDMGEMHDTHLKGVVAVGEAEQAVQASAAVTLEALVADSPAASAAIVT